MLLNKPRAYEVMDKYGVDGLVASAPKNVYYLTDFYGSLMKMQRDFTTFALFPRREDAPAALAITGTELYRLTHMPSWVPNVIAASYRAKPGQRDFDPAVEEPEAADFTTWPVRSDGEVQAGEQRWSEIAQRHAGRQAVTPIWGLARAIKDAGLEHATLGSDDPRVVAWLNEMGLPKVKGVEATNIFHEIRMIKSPAEIEILRTAARVNESACNAAIQALQVGAAWDEIETTYMVEMAKHGGQGVYITPGPGGLPSGRVRQGEPVMLDALGKWKHYHGDIGRTAVAGEPTAEMLRCNKAMRVGLETAYEMVKDGASAGDMTRRVLEAVHKAGFPGFLIVTPHSVGLEHTDHPVALGPELPGAKGDIILRSNMVINIDMPYHELGWGAMHLEDTILVKPDGCEVLTSGDTSLRVVPG